LWAIVGSLAGYLGYLDFGVGGSFVKFITEYVERDDRASARQVITFGLVFYVAFGLVLAAPILIFAPQIVHVFKMSPALYPQAATLLRILFGIFVASIISGVPGSVVVAMHRMDLASRNTFFAYLAYATTTFTFLRLDYGITAIICGQLAQIVVAASLQTATARRLFGPLWYNPLRIERAIVRRMFAFGGWTQLTSIFSVVNLDVGRFIAAAIVNVASVGLYEIASKLAFFARIYPGYLLSALLPAASGADARDDAAALERMHGAGTRYTVFATLLCAGWVIGGADAMVRVWLGQAYPHVAAIVFWLALGYAINSLAGVGATILRASGEPRYEAYSSGLGTVVNIAATVPLAHAYGIVGVAMGTALGWLAGTAYFLWVFHRVRHFGWLVPVASPVLRLAVAAAISTAAYDYAMHATGVAQVFEHRVAGLIVLLASGAVYGALFIGLSAALGTWVHDAPDLRSRFAAVRARFGAPAH
jgi:O-antigen/teichoic acid export membrane protein